MYTPIGLKAGSTIQRVNSLTPYQGENLRQFSSLLQPSQALKVSNYIPDSEGVLVKRKGYDLLFEVAGTNGITLLDRYTSGVMIFAYNTTLAVFTESSETITNIKTDFTSGGVIKGARYGDYYFVCNGKDKIHRVSQTIGYDAQTANFTAGEVITGGTSGATATVLEDSDSGTSGTLTLGNIQGTFVDDEAVTGSEGGAADIDGTLSYAITEVSASPVCSVLTVVGNRLVAGNLGSDNTAVQYSEVDDGSNPPFTAWSNTTTATAGGLVNYRQAGTVNDVISLGKLIIVFSDFGKWGFAIDQIDSGGTIKKIDQTIFDRKDLGGERALVTDKGVFYVNEAGLWQLVSVGQEDVPYSDQEFKPSYVLGRDYFNEIDFSGSDIVYNDLDETLYIACKNGSAVNNYVIAHNTETKAFYRVTNWPFNVFLQDSDGEIYAGSSSFNKVFHLFQGYDDNGVPITTEYYQELNVGNLDRAKDLMKFGIQAKMSTDTEFTVSFDIYDYSIRFRSNYKSYCMTISQSDNAGVGYGEVGYGSGYGSAGGTTNSDPTQNFDTSKKTVRNFQRIFARITETSSTYHEINMFDADIKLKSYIRRRKIVEC